ncbi:glycogen debranching protein GlgX [Microbacterium oleivorans]|uniref:glycogen debranching protein GlgX n=1 Tax=Microbacterium oleivorans TaxID=273677 RepID=UPI00203B81C8|nr:glycogen debranching protein GlgX [Microbacterium oleivorans]MCM3696796.1 glycogen debranching protein GlgX [Microbacterium oleivorans]
MTSAPAGPTTAASDTPTAGLLSDVYDDLGVRLHDGGGTLRVWSEHATELELVVFDDDDPDWIVDTVPLTAVGGGVWEATTPALRVGVTYSVRVDGPHGPGMTFNPATLLIDPYARGLSSPGIHSWRSVVVDECFDWGDVRTPATPLDRTVVYEAHVRGLTKRHPGVPAALHGTYAGVAHPAMIEHYRSLGVTAIELLPIHAFASEPRLLQLGLTNYWGYNSVGFFAPHAAYATATAQAEGPTSVLRELKGMVKLLHAAGIEVILDVVFNHTSEQGLGEPRSSFRGLDNRSYYRQAQDGTYIDVTGCGNSLDTSTDAAARLVLDSLRYWANDVQIDGFRFDLAPVLGRDRAHTFTPEHPLLQAIIEDPALEGVKMIAEPWDVGMGGWQTGGFGPGWSEWNDRYRDRVRNFWLSDIDYSRRADITPVGIGGFATRLAGSANTFSSERGPLASVNFVTAHDGFTLHDLVSYDSKRNDANGEHGRDGADTNRSFNHGFEGPTDDEGVLAARRRAMRNLLGTLLLSAGVPMLTAGDETGRTQNGNNNAYCHDSALTWYDWSLQPWQEDLRAHVEVLTRIRRENPALRPVRFAHAEKTVPGASVIDWYDEGGHTMSVEQWTDPSHRTLQYDARSTPENEAANRTLLVVHGRESDLDITLPSLEGITRFVPLWSSVDERPQSDAVPLSPGDGFTATGPSMYLFRAE